MKTKLFRGIAIALAMVMCLAVGAFAATNLQEIKAYLNYDLAIRYDGELQTMHDANGNQVLPISYNGTTYLPIRAVGNMMGIDVLWDSENYQVLLGKTGQAIDFIENFEPYSKSINYKHYKESANKGITLGSKSYSNMICISREENRGYYDIRGQYDVLTFSVYSNNDQTLIIYGDNDEVLTKINIKKSNLPQTYYVNVTGVQQLCFESANVWVMIDYESPIYILDVTIE